MHAHLRRLDLNLLLVFEALHRCGSVVTAAADLSMSASAFSHALTRLRGALSDELFVRDGSVMRPTARAEALAAGIAQALQLLTDHIGDARTFDPGSSAQTFVFAATDFTSFALLPELIARVERLAPGVRLQVLPSLSGNALDDLAAGAHFFLGFSDDGELPSAGVACLTGPVADYVVAARRGHPRIGARLDLETYLRERHVVVRPWKGTRSVIDTALATRALTRDVAVELPSVMAAPFIVGHSDLLITLPRLAAMRLADSARVDLHELPITSPTYTPTACFHSRHMNAGWHRWMRELLRAVLSGEAAPLARSRPRSTK
ncbi:LysR family transcriptional regulator [Pseudaquabacterium rugosum]|uniref:LysR family transcriptional regulator n=1 Tax=Pseudaquabacterium rugosum TaxID=2984194 RepID=A0ABU9BA93_9BURK